MNPGTSYRENPVAHVVPLVFQRSDNEIWSKGVHSIELEEFCLGIPFLCFGITIGRIQKPKNKENPNLRQDLPSTGRNLCM